MPDVSFQVDARRAVARFEAIGPAVSAALAEQLGAVAQEAAADARGLAVAHIRYLGKKPGQYLASIYGGVTAKPGRVIGWVRSGDPLAHLLEFGTGERFRKHLNKAAKRLADVQSGFTGSMPPYPALTPAFQAHVGDVEAAVRQAIGEAAR